MGKPHSKPPPIKKFDHITIEVSDLQAALAFYSDILGLFPMTMPAELADQGICWLDLGKGDVLHLVENPGARPGKTAHIAIEVQDLQAWKDYLATRKVQMFPPKLDLYRAARVFILDPSGNRIELIRWL